MMLLASESFEFRDFLTENTIESQNKVDIRNQDKKLHRIGIVVSKKRKFDFFQTLALEYRSKIDFFHFSI